MYILSVTKLESYHLSHKTTVKDKSKCLPSLPRLPFYIFIYHSPNIIPQMKINANIIIIIVV